MSADLITTFDLPGLLGRLNDAERRVLTKNETKIMKFIGEYWTGWMYAGRGANKINVSVRAWRSKLQTTEQPFALVIDNTATTKRGVEYAGFVQRAGRTGPGRPHEYEVMGAAIQAQFEAPMLAELTRAVAAALMAPGPPRRLNRNRGAYVTTGRTTVA